VRLQVVLQLPGTNFHRLIGSKNHENLKSVIFQLSLITMGSGVLGINNSNI
jgi:hypothetical protein